MSKKTFLVGFGCCVLGLAFGIGGTYVAMRLHSTKHAAKTLSAVEQMKLGEESERAHHAYRHESKPVAIYALSQYVKQLKQVEEMPDNPHLMTGRMLAFDLTLAHARLARLYAETGETNLSAQHLTHALAYAQKSPAAGITNQTGLAELIDKLDRQAAK